MEDKYQSKHVQAMFSVSPETVRNWASQFEEFVSPSANPPKGRTRKFTFDDLKVFALIAQMKKDAALFTEIHDALGNGQRAEPPKIPDDLLDIAASDTGMKLLSMLQDLTDRVGSLESGTDRFLLAENSQLKTDRDELLKQIGRLEARLEMAQNKEG